MKHLLFIALASILCACSVPVESENDTASQEQADNGDPNTVGIPNGCRIEYLVNDPKHLKPIMICEFYNEHATNTPDPDPFRAVRRVETIREK